MSSDVALQESAVDARGSVRYRLLLAERCGTCAKGRDSCTAVADAEHRCHARDEFVYWFDEPESE